MRERERVGKGLRERELREDSRIRQSHVAIYVEWLFSYTFAFLVQKLTTIILFYSDYNRNYYISLSIIMRNNLLIFAILFLLDRPIDCLNFELPVPCKSDVDCSLLSKDQKNSTCLNKFCACENEQGKMFNCSGLQIASQQEKAIVPTLYHPCKHDLDCQLNNSYCNTSRSQCECIKGFVFSMDKQQCLQAARSLNFPCIEDKQCLAFQPNTTCQGLECVCIDGYHAVNNVCWKIAVFGGSCSTSEECNHIKGAICTDKKICGCNENNAIDKTGKNCVPFVNNINESCMENITCSTIPDSTCIENKCQCPNDKHFVAETGQCIRSKSIGEPCKHDYECYQLENNTKMINKRLVCVGSICDCAVDYFKDGDKCVNAGVLMNINGSLMVIMVALSSFIYGFYH
ncbi:PREDICTED: fibrillin-2-like [Polistes dominula]|uniref:Fibrillin-2-like n=1 Tax=Polistes dominula TaxID=743375 RepID=A0ABM1IRH6_POLDO|nr:PREDICTED: fibrillin-2-like [Polistes dominula]